MIPSQDIDSEATAHDLLNEATDRRYRSCRRSTDGAGTCFDALAARQSRSNANITGRLMPISRPPPENPCDRAASR
jgi:hypothetical protein